MHAIELVWGWIDRHGLALFIGYVLGTITVRYFHTNRRREPACYYHQWLAEFTRSLKETPQKK